jgi:hypothetical protein
MADSHELLDPRSPWFWWWRKIKGTDYDSANHRVLLKKPRLEPVKIFEFARDTFDARQIGFYRYEIARRHDRSKRWPPYPQADPFTRDLLMDIWVKGQPMQVPGLRSDESVSAWLKRITPFIKKEDQKRSIKRPKGPSKPTRFVTWERVELLDRADILNEKLDRKSQRKLLHARKEARKFFERMKVAMRHEHEWFSLDE